MASNTIIYPQPHAQQQQYFFDDGTGTPAPAEDIDPMTDVESSPTTPMVSGVNAAPVYDPERARMDESNALLFLILSFFVGGYFLWIIIYLHYRNSPSERARTYSKIAGFLVIAPIVVFGILLFLGTVVAIIGDPNSK